MSESLFTEAAIFHGGPDGDTAASLTRWPGSREPSLKHGDTAWPGSALSGRKWRVTAVRPHPDGSETYDLLPA